MPTNEAEQMLAHNSLGFHESTLTGIDANGQNMVLGFEDVKLGERLVKARIIIQGIRSIICNGQVKMAIGLESNDAEVLSVDFTTEQIKLIVEWNDFANHSSHTSSYIFSCGSYELQTG